MPDWQRDVEGVGHTSHDLDTGPHDAVRLETGQDDLDVCQERLDLFRLVERFFRGRKLVLGLYGECEEQKGISASDETTRAEWQPFGSAGKGSVQCRCETMCGALTVHPTWQ